MSGASVADRLRQAAARLDPVAAWGALAQREVAKGATERDPEFVRKLLPQMRRFARWFAADVRGFDRVPPGQVLLVGNHSGGVMTPDTTALYVAWYDQRGFDDQLVGLGFDAAFALPGIGPILRRLGLIPASHGNADRAIERGHSVLVYPGGAHEAFRPWADRNTIDFGGHKGFVRLALRHGIPVVPVVGHGGHETLMVLTRGDGLGRHLGGAHLRVDIVPVVLHAPWGITLPILPSLPLPAKITVEVLEPMAWGELGPGAADDPAVVDRCYAEITSRMQTTLDQLAAETPRPLRTRLTRWLRGHP